MRKEGERIKVLFSVGRLSVGGAEKLLVHHLAAIDIHTYDPKLITIFGEQKDSFADRAHIDECFHFHSTFDVPAFIKLYKYLRRERFDVVVTHLFTANLLVRTAAIFARVPVIIGTEHNIYPNKRKWQIFTDKILSLWTDRIISDSKAAARCSSGQAGIPMEKFTPLFIPPLLDRRAPKDESVVRSDLGIGPATRVILTVSRLVIDKGHVHLIDAAPKVLALHRDVCFVIVGWGPLKDDLEAQAVRLGVSDRVKLPGRMDIQDVLPLAEVYVDPAVSTDLPVAIMEAMREGKAVVATEIGEIPEFVQNEKTGLIVKPGNDMELAEAIQKILSDPELRVRLGAAAKKKVEELSMENFTRQFDEIVAFHLSKKQV